MKELVATAPGQPALVDYEDGQLPKGHIRVRVERGSPKHGTELVRYSGQRPLSFPYPLGNICVGRVVEVAEDVKGLNVGDRVAGYGHLRETHSWRAEEVMRLGERMTWKEAVCYDPAQYALAGVRDSSLRVGDCAAVFGLGAIGQMAVQLARIAGASLVAAIDPIELRRNVALEGGADIAFDPATQDVGAELKHATDGLDVVIETSGSYRALNDAIKCLAYGGTVALVGWSRECKGGLDFGEVAHFIVPNIVFARACSEPNRDHPRWSLERIRLTCWRMLSEGRLKCESVVQPVVQFAQSAGAYKEYVELHPDRSIKLGVEFS